MRNQLWSGHKGADGYSKYDQSGWTHKHSRLNGVGTRVEHDGRVEGCPNRTCQMIAERQRKLIWGTFCEHGLQIVEAAPALHTCDRPVNDPPGLFTCLLRGCPAL